MSVPRIIYQIDEVIRNKSMPREKKVKSLPNPAVTCWQEVIPEYRNSKTAQNLESAEIRKRWAKVHDEVEKYETKSQILSVLDWPASNGNFYWLQ